MYDVLDYGKCCDLVLFEFFNAFNMVDYFLLFKKLANLHLSDALFNIKYCFLCNRKQKVKIKNTYSTFLPNTSGVPQGTVLARKLFLIFLNDLITSPFINRISAFADNLKLLGLSGDKLQADINFIYKWILENKLSINEIKCVVNNFGKNNSHTNYFLGSIQLVCETAAKDFGVFVDVNLCFN